MATHSSFIAWEMPWIVKPGGLLTKSWTQLSGSYTHSHNEQNEGNLLTNVLGKLRGRVDSRHDRNEEFKPYHQPLLSLPVLQF